MAHAAVTFQTEAVHHPITVNVVFPTDKMVLPDKYIPKRKPNENALSSGKSYASVWI